MKIELKKNLKNKLLNLYSYFKSKNKRELHNIGIDKAHTIGIIFKYKDLDSQKKINYFVKYLKGLGKTVHAICYIDSISKDYDFKYPSFYFNDINFKGKISEKKLKEFININFDYLYLMEFDPEPILKYITVKNNAKCKIGYFNESIADYVDIMIKIDNTDLDNFIKQLIKYTLVLKS